MAIKKLQNNFTTPEQSKRLLELGVPADSADMLWDGCVYPTDGWEFDDFPTYSDKPFSYYQSLYRQEDVAHILPCWSVGRLIEIFTTCAEYYTGDNSLVFNRESVLLGNIKCLIPLIELAVKDRHINFSNLEEARNEQ